MEKKVKSMEGKKEEGEKRNLKKKKSKLWTAPHEYFTPRLIQNEHYQFDV